MSKEDIGKMLEMDMPGDDFWGDFGEIDTKEIPSLQISIPTRLKRWTVDLIRLDCSPKAASQTRHPIKPTAYLDGLRGFAAFLVYWHHHQLWAHEATSPSQNKILENAFGYEKQYYFACLPFVRLFFTGGHFAVTVFFVISGMVLANKPLKLIQSGDYLGLGDNLASALFRRWIRLYTPVIATTFLFMSSWHVFGLWTASAEPQNTYGDEIWKWYCDFKNFSFVFSSGGEPWFTYNFHTWSIPVEFRGSTAVYTSLLAFSRCTRQARMWCLFALISYFMYIVDGSFYAMFISGTLLSDISLSAENHNLPGHFYRLESLEGPTFSVLFLSSLYLGGAPSHSSDPALLLSSPGWFFLSFLKPQAVFDFKWFYLFLAATMLVASIPHLPRLKAFFESDFNQYLGRISFALYLVHGPVLWTLGDRLYVATGWVREIHLKHLQHWVGRYPIPSVGPLGLELNFLAVHLVNLPITICLAEMVTKVVDERSVKFSSWLYSKAVAPSSRELKR